MAGIGGKRARSWRDTWGEIRRAFATVPAACTRDCGADAGITIPEAGKPGDIWSLTIGTPSYHR